MAIYEYKAKCRRVIDGDTVELEVDMGFHLTTVHHFRLVGVDTPELRGGTEESKAAARKARDRVKELLFAIPEDNSMPVDLRIQTFKADSFGRYLATVRFFKDSETGPEWKSLSELLIEEGLGEPYVK